MDENKGPLSLFLCITSILALITSFPLATWWIDASRFPQSSADIVEIQSAQTSEEPMNELQQNARHISHAMMSVGCLTVIFGGILLMNGIDYFMIVRGKKENCMTKPYFEKARQLDGDVMK